MWSEARLLEEALLKRLTKIAPLVMQEPSPGADGPFPMWRSRPRTPWTRSTIASITARLLVYLLFVLAPVRFGMYTDIQTACCETASNRPGRPRLGWAELGSPDRHVYFFERKPPIPVRRSQQSQTRCSLPQMAFWIKPRPSLQRPVALALLDTARCCFRRDTTSTCGESHRGSPTGDRKA